MTATERNEQNERLAAYHERRAAKYDSEGDADRAEYNRQTARAYRRQIVAVA
ncbi:hypothetical protein [Rhizobium azibense]|uniref:Uncharacterized protein n=1 Tax=Rhizobium azibense TaxID=1136135 RepID=A0A4R3RI42_9HYPH|nr:hypothetical protein [Rhizobium azibense]TCU34107.1 hypothetical protein EV129_11390 [Rhizobium azibense]